MTRAYLGTQTVGDFEAAVTKRRRGKPVGSVGEKEEKE